MLVENRLFLCPRITIASVGGDSASIAGENENGGTTAVYTWKVMLRYAVLTQRMYKQEGRTDRQNWH